MDDLKLRFNSSMTPAGSNLVEYYQKLQIQSSAPDDGRKHRPKHVELIGNKEINQKTASCWSSITIILTMQGHTNVKDMTSLC
jgi:hypothetical protein